MVKQLSLCLHSLYKLNTDISVADWWVSTFIYSRGRLFISWYAADINKSDFPRSKRKISMPATRTKANHHILAKDCLLLTYSYL